MSAIKGWTIVVYRAQGGIHSTHFHADGSIVTFSNIEEYAKTLKEQPDVGLVEIYRTEYRESAKVMCATLLSRWQNEILMLGQPAIKL